MTEPLWKDEWEPSEQDYADMLQSAKQENDNERDITLLYNTITKKKQNYQSFRKQYGKEWADIYLKAANNNEPVSNEVSSEFWKSSLNIVKNTGSIVNKKIGGKSNYKIESFFVPIIFPIIDDIDLWKRISKYMGLYIFLFRHIVRGKMKDDKFNIFKDYYGKGKLAYATSYRELGKTNSSRGTAGRHAKALKKIGAIKIDKLKTKVKNKQGIFVNAEESVFVLGTHNMKEKPDNKETYYINVI